ncbi:MAG: YggS family pyridoxal phosphate-dependent enzyme [Deltaproteobacteria bacterium CG12_big_fil_rev_8_21_14_0_65_43_10]|nr:MAG: YggS family pyridoxal phosphate enzyme [Deltaproteobacteria bacterium CG2_30_43_15]PIQ46407.1 MAG: YggS family pyridoxal phosphate-dependent enzyme [Deltaproteobacteria bacterium CG12_big_fil_rev_8_21_14_0_65_43_10]PIU85430.1 MAG: YggS family pyridoxal phosphate-dependent enzyme [Deltaproteobacteria bacterium CG06_land_8_20_14_3_00_44_19]PIX24469.1 MAG: YggS family pyridoxal phosphate-dependent enzyme [Deltaproteobacteria bacterium CG_4_8_14_3_um_filter_43_13]PIZ18631.1 MAG: YggS family
MSQIADNLLLVKERVEKAALKAGRDPGEIKLVAVSKTVGVEEIREAISAGATILGESYVQEAKEKIEEIDHQVQWHMIGHLQTNKVKQAINLFDMIHSVDRIGLAEEINKRAKQSGKRVSVLIQVNISQETTKSGIERDRAISLVLEVSNLTNLKVEGLMTMPPYFDDPDDARPYFKSLRELKGEIGGERFENISMKELSMGMSNDFEIAIEEGATIIRVGTAIFGERE